MDHLLRTGHILIFNLDLKKCQSNLLIVALWLVTCSHIWQINLSLPVPLHLLTGTVACPRTLCAWSESCWCWTLSRGLLQERCWSRSVSSLPHGNCSPCWIFLILHKWFDVGHFKWTSSLLFVIIPVVFSSSQAVCFIAEWPPAGGAGYWRSGQSPRTSARGKLCEIYDLSDVKIKLVG